MIRVGFILSSSVAKWNGGINYFSNIFKLLNEIEGFTPVLLCAPELREIVNSRFPDLEASYYDFLSYNSFSDIIRKSILYSCSYEPYIDYLIKAKHIDVISHNDRFPLNNRTLINSCSWIPDLQSFRLPELQPAKANNRERWLWSRMIETSTYVIVSSYDSKKDLIEMFPDTPTEKVKVLHFTVPPVDNTDYLEIYSEDELQKYHVEPFKYYMVSNQFWKHKNHIIVAKALNTLLETYGSNLGFKVIATGLTKDPRGMEVFNELEDYLKSSGLTENFILTGNIPYSEVKLLQYYSIAVIQPSFFEGWNTAVEECKATGKKVLLSNIGVHIEQAPSNGVFFNPNDFEGLAVILKNIADNYDREHENQIENKARCNQHEIWAEFRKNYLQILNNTINAE